jgi:hypothetical protein
MVLLWYHTHGPTGNRWEPGWWVELRRLCSCGSMDFPFPASSDLGIIALFVRIITKWKELHTLRPDACPYSSELHICHALHAHDVTSPVSHLHTQLETVGFVFNSTSNTIGPSILFSSPVRLLEGLTYSIYLQGRIRSTVSSASQRPSRADGSAEQSYATVVVL